MRLKRAPTGLRSLGVSRALLEGQIRRRLVANPRLTVLDDREVRGLDFSEGRVRGARVVRRGGDGAGELLPAELVVDATGRGSKAPMWLRDGGFDAPEEERVSVGVGYTTAIYERRPGDMKGDGGVVIAALPPNRRCGVALAVENDRWMVTMAGYLGDHAPATHQGLLDYSRTLPASDLHHLLSTVTPLSEPFTARYPHSQRRRYERLARFPEGFVVLGDALSSFNPIYGQGMSVAALESELLAASLGAGLARVGPRFFRAATRLVDVPWSMAVGGDLAFDEVVGPRTTSQRFLQRYISWLSAAAAEDAVAASTFIRVTNLVSPPLALFAPRTLASVLYHGLRRDRDARPSGAPASARTGYAT